MNGPTPLQVGYLQIRTLRFAGGRLNARIWAEFGSASHNRRLITVDADDVRPGCGFVPMVYVRTIPFASINKQRV